MKFDSYHNLKTAIALAAGAVTATGNGEIINTDGFESLTFAINSATITDGTTYTFSLTHGDESDGSDFTAVTGQDVLAEDDDVNVVYLPGDDDVAKRIGYVGKKQYVRLVVTVVGASTGGVFAATAVLGNPNSAPVAA